MFEPHVEKVLSLIKPSDNVLDVGGWACPFNRANWVLDAGPFETRGYYGTKGLLKSQGGDKEYFNRDTWVQRDICEKTPWPFKDKFFDFSMCSHTLEDLRDPISVCAELVRVSKRGYIEVPSRLAESCRGWEHRNLAGLSHHRWLVEIKNNHMLFTQKYHMIHTSSQLSFPTSFLWKLSEDQKITYLFWDDQFTFSENTIHGLDSIRKFYSDYVEQHRPVSHFTKLKELLGDQFGNICDKFSRGLRKWSG